MIVRMNLVIEICLLLQSLNFIHGKDCSASLNGTRVICSDNEFPPIHLMVSLANYTNLTELSIIHSYLTEMPDLNDHHQLSILHLDHNQISLFHRSYSSVEYLYLTHNHLYSLHQTNLSYPNVKLLDLSHNPIEHLIDGFFSEKQFPKLEILKLTNAFSHLNHFLIDNRFISFQSLTFLREISLDENDFEDFSCSSNSNDLQWKFPFSLEKIFFGKNKLMSFDVTCLFQMTRLIELDFHSNYLRHWSPINVVFPSLVKLRLDSNFLTMISPKFLRSLTNLTELDLSSNLLQFPGKQSWFPDQLRILHLNSMSNDLTCALFDNLHRLEQLHLSYLPAIELEQCTFKNLKHLKMLNLSFHHLKTIDHRIFRPLLDEGQLEMLDIRSSSMQCDSCSTRWLIDHLKSHNETTVKCFDQYEKDKLLNQFHLPLCPSSRLISIFIVTLSILFSLLLFLLFFIYSYQRRKIPLFKYSPVYHMVPLRYPNRIYQNTTEDITNDNVMLVTT